MSLDPDPLVEATCGLMLSPDMGSVALVRKNRPEFQAGLLNGPGGKLEPGEQPIDAMIREFREETGAETTVDAWQRLLEFHAPGWLVHFFCCTGDLSSLRQVTDEAVVVVPIVGLGAARVVHNLLWIVPFAVDALQARDYELPLVVRELQGTDASIPRPPDDQPMPGATSVEWAIISMVRTTPGGCVPAELQEQLERSGLASDDIRNAVSQLWDRGMIQLGADRRLHPRA